MNDIKIMNKKQKEALVSALLEKGETYRDIAKKAGVSPNTIKAIANKHGLNESTSMHSRAYELFSEGKNPLQVAIALNLGAEEALQYHRQYLILLGCTDFTRLYPQIKDNPWPYVKLVQLTQNSGMGDGEVQELLEIANGHLPSVKLEYERLKAKTISLEARLSNTVQAYQRFTDQNIKFKKRENELLLSINKLENEKAGLQQSINELETKKVELQKRFDELKSEFHSNKADDTNPHLEVKHDNVFPTIDVFVPPSPPDTSFDYHKSEDATFSNSQGEQSSKRLIFDTKDLSWASSLQDQQE